MSLGTPESGGRVLLERLDRLAAGDPDPADLAADLPGDPGWPRYRVELRADDRTWVTTAGFDGPAGGVVLGAFTLSPDTRAGADDAPTGWGARPETKPASGTIAGPRPPDWLVAASSALLRTVFRQATAAGDQPRWPRRLHRWRRAPQG
ncbi:MAG TPA: hypothetical protein RMF84_06305 [Polyangiaceae bacterium LLY-WYZ-14_1]|nr:hypothetical protein [Polyangiaceae bacterium LLY-WYZ-14_1]